VTPRRTADIADIHGNPEALEAVIDDIRAVAVDEVIVAGDLVGRGPCGDAIVRRIKALGWPCLRGNHEDYLLSFVRREVPEQWYGCDEWAGSEWMANELSPEAVEFIDALPFTLSGSSMPELRVVHGSPVSHTEGLGNWTDEATLAERLCSIDEPVLVCGHTHRPMVRQVGEGLVVNVGSVGLAFNGDKRAHYGLFEARAGELPTVEIRKVEYDRDAFLERYRTTGFLEDGNVTARLLECEVRSGRPHLVPFLAWCKYHSLNPHLRHVPSFSTDFDPDASIARFFDRLQRGLVPVRDPEPTEP
jgi:putative phosphoesterase